MVSKQKLFDKREKNINSISTLNAKEYNLIFLIVAGIILVGIAGFYSYAFFSSVTNSTAIITGTVVSPREPTGAESIIEKVGTDGLVKDSYPATDQLSANEGYRYTGGGPNNYVSFNNELWRIIGVFRVYGNNGYEMRMKIIRNESIGSIAWDTTGSNDWTKASGMTLLNSGDYWNRTGDYASTGLTAEAKQKIDSARWYLGGLELITSYNPKDFYTYERGRTVSSGYKTYWDGKVALMYVSDYGYATSGDAATTRDVCMDTEIYSWDGASVVGCINSNWLYESSHNEWTLGISLLTDEGVKKIITGYVDGKSIYDGANMRPTVYLKSDIKITGGTGTSSNPYLLS